MTAKKTALLTKDDVRAFYEHAAHDVTRFRARNAYYYRLYQDLLRFVIPAGKRVLDIGCGPGDLLDALDPSHGVGVDLSPAMVEIAKRAYPHITFLEGDVEERLAVEGPFDYIVLSHTAAFLTDIQGAFQQLHTYASEETRIVIVSYNYLWEPVLKLAERLGLKMREPILNWLAPDDLENLMRLEGFEPVRRHEAVLIPRNIPLISFLLNRVFAHAPLIRRFSLIKLAVFRLVQSAQPQQQRSCSVVIPARNERGNIERIIRELPLAVDWEVIFVEGHSTDGTYEEIGRLAQAHPDRKIILLKQDGEGKADAVRKGLAHASGDILMILDADLTVDPRQLIKFYDAVATGKGELVIGNRLVYQMQRESMRFLNLVGNKFFSVVFSYILDQRIKDTLCGTKAFSRRNYESMNACRRFFGSIDPFGDFDLLFGAAMANLRILEIPVRYEARRYGVTQIKRFQHGFLLLKMAIRGVWKMKFH